VTSEPDERGTTRALDCNELVELVTEYFDDALDAKARARLEEHLAACEGCRTYLDQMRATIEAAGRLEPEVVPPDVLGRLTAAFRETRQG